MARSVGNCLQDLLLLLTIEPLGMAIRDWLVGILLGILLFVELSMSPFLSFLGTVLLSSVPCRGLR